MAEGSVISILNTIRNWHSLVPSINFADLWLLLASSSMKQDGHTAYPAGWQCTVNNL